MKLKKMKLSDIEYVQFYFKFSSEFFIEFDKYLNKYFEDFDYDEIDFTHDIIHIYKIMKVNLKIKN